MARARGAREKRTWPAETRWPFCAGAVKRLGVVSSVMSRSPNLLPGLLSLTLLGAWIASCSEDKSSGCTPGETRLCSALGRCQGVQSCLADGSGYDECDCSAGPRNGTGGSSTEEGPTPLVGRACSEDVQCGSGLRCYPSDANDFFGAGPAGGYCSLPCTQNTECTGVDPQSQCESGLCLRTCRSMDPTSVRENKCLTRRDVVCQSEAYLGVTPFSGLRQAGLCMPQCGSDEDCGARFCDLARGLCVTTRPAGAPVGAECEVNSDCLGGSCVNADGSGLNRLCTGPCVFGQPVGCGDGVSADPRNYACLSPLIGGAFSSEGLGDVGFCVEVCDVDADCAQVQNGFACRPDPRVAPVGRIGFCLTATPTDAGDAGDGGLDSGAGDADASDASN